ncbi:hypothetical protein A3197_10145 [Candidatus Thiodiazotropha endoloripes]|nr:hypothetical protein [Candidatus Thiodiazotropha lotti]MCW4218355.1 DapH/DapD/GlmU-related protein [Candidatus Thiodiazotropha lotti]ODC00663.1 hypothetical protein A3197_10145 [Candidatus Thiodiazotropha endoloripes]
MMISHIKKDLQRYYKIELNGNMNPSTMAIARLLIDNAGLQAVIIYRFGRHIRDLVEDGKGLAASVMHPLYKILNWIACKAFGIDISQDADIGSGFYIGHFGGIVIQKCNIGENCSISQQVNIIFQEDAVSTIGSSVWMGAHAYISPGVTIGSHATVAAGARVDSDFSDNVLIMGSPARVLSANYDNSRLL